MGRLSTKWLWSGFITGVFCIPCALDTAIVRKGASGGLGGEAIGRTVRLVLLFGLRDLREVALAPDRRLISRSARMTSKERRW